MNFIVNITPLRLPFIIMLDYFLKNRSIFILMSLLTISGPAWANFLLIGKMKASVCSGVVFQTCSFENVDAVGASSGQLYEPARQYGSVSEFDPQRNQCWIRMKTGSFALDAFKGSRLPDFFTKKDGRFVKIKPDYLVFSCRRV